MSTIKILPENLINKIAAGEVVERPASVVKELVENSVDAKAKNITAAVKGGGKQYIKIVDDGTGMGKDDALLAFERHATSKIREDNDLKNIFSLGFRGEALPSIASVSDITLTTSAKGGHAAQIILSGGQIKQVREAACPQGATIEIQNLFFNTPARAKFLKSNTTELSHISRIIIQESLANPDIYFKLQSNNRTVIDSPPIKDQLKHKIADLFGNELTDQLLEVKSELNDMSLHGFISKPSITRASRENQYLFVNNRHIRDRIVSHALSEAYSRTLPNNRHPVTFLYLSINPEAVDVNVHPSKMEVRFYDQGAIHDFVRDAVYRALYSPPPNRLIKKELPVTSNTKNTVSSFYNNDKKTRIQEAVENYISSDTAANKYSETYNKNLSSAVSPFVCAEFRPLGQINNSFIVAENKSGMVIIDQHTAHERILYESLLEELKSSKIEIQSLLLPIKIELNKGESIILQNNIDSINRVGIELESFGPSTFILRAVPSVMVGQDYLKVVMDIVDTLSQYEKVSPFEDIVEKLAATMACHAAVKANQRLKPEEIEHLLVRLGSSGLPSTCPHGRPIVLFYDIKDIEKKFMR